MSEYISAIREFVAIINPVFILFIIYFLGMYVFWRGTAESRKNRSSVFDMFLVSGIFSVLVGRITYIIVEWTQFYQFIWYWLPYEKYGDKIFLFRLLPWRFLNIWTGELIIVAMFASLILTATVYTLVIKKWRWKHLFFPIYFSAVSMLSFSFLFSGFVNEVTDWIFKGAVLISAVIAFFGLYNFFVSTLNNPVKKKLVIGYVGLLFVWLTTVYIGYIYLTSNLSLVENAFVILFLIWSLVSGVFFVIDLRKASVSIESISTVRSVNSTRVQLD